MNQELHNVLVQASGLIAGATRVELIVEDGRPARLITEFRHNECSLTIRVYRQNAALSEFNQIGGWVE